MGKRKRSKREKLKRLKRHLSKLLSSSSESSSDESQTSESDYDSDSDYEDPQLPIPMVTQIDDDIKELLGDNPNAGEKDGPEIHEEIVTRWSAVLKSGMEKETLKALLEKYAIAKNCLQLKSPKLNGEIRTCLPEKSLKQDNFL